MVGVEVDDAQGPVGAAAVGQGVPVAGERDGVDLVVGDGERSPELEAAVDVVQRDDPVAAHHGDGRSVGGAHEVPDETAAAGEGPDRRLGVEVVQRELAAERPHEELVGHGEEGAALVPALDGAEGLAGAPVVHRHSLHRAECHPVARTAGARRAQALELDGGLDTATVAVEGLHLVGLAVAEHEQDGGLPRLAGHHLGTSDVPATSYFTFNTATGSVVSTLPDLLDLLDAWMEGALFADGRQPTPDDFPSERAADAGDLIVALSVPVNGYCPCEPAGEGNTTEGIGRGPNAPGSDLWLIEYPDGISVALHYNSNEEEDKAAMREVADQAHQAAATAL